MARFMRLVNRFSHTGAHRHSAQAGGFRRRGMRLAWLGPLVAVALALAGCDNDVRYVSPPPPPPVPPPPPPEYGLIFEDTFDGEALDGDKWTVASGNGCPEVCFGGDEDAWQYSEGNVSVRDGSLFIEGGRNADGGYLSGAVHTQGKFDFRYGRVVVGARLPVDAGVLPSIRLLPADRSLYGPWPASGEIGVAEGLSPGADGGPAVRGITRYGLTTPPFHGASFEYDLGQPTDLRLVEYAIEWERDELRFFLDGVHVRTQTSQEWFAYYPANADGRYDALGAYQSGDDSAPFDQAFHLVLDLMVAAEQQPLTVFPQFVEVDYVRVYECTRGDAETGAGCGSADADITPLRDTDGGPLQGLETAKPYLERLDLYVDGPATLKVKSDGAELEGALIAGVVADEAATVVSDLRHPDPADADNQVWRISASGGAAEIYLVAPDLSQSDVLRTGFDFSGNRLTGPGGEPVGEIAFDLRVQAMAPEAALSIGLDSGFPDARPFELPKDQIVGDEWGTYSVKFTDLLDGSDSDCCGLDLKNLVRPFIFRAAGGDVDVLLDNIRVTNACRVVGACGAGTTEVSSPQRSCTVGNRVLNHGFYAHFEPLSYSADADPAAPGFNTPLGYEADLLTALEALRGAGLSFSHRGIGPWEGIWLRSAAPEYDLIGGGITILDSRTRNASGEVVVRFTEGHVAFRQSLLVHAEDAARLADHASLTSDVRVGVLGGTTGEARLLQLTGLVDERGALAAGTRIDTPRGVLVADGSLDYRITAAVETPNVAGRLRLHPPGPDMPQVIYLGADLGEIELLQALRDRTIDAVARGEIGNSDAAAASGGRFVVTGIDPQAEYGGFTVAAENTALLSCLNDKIRWLTNGGRIGYAQWLADPDVFLGRAEVWNRSASVRGAEQH